MSRGLVSAGLWTGGPATEAPQVLCRILLGAEMLSGTRPARGEVRHWRGRLKDVLGLHYTGMHRSVGDARIRGRCDGRI